MNFLPWCHYRLGCFKPYAGVKTGVLVFRRPVSQSTIGNRRSTMTRFGSTRSEPTVSTRTRSRAGAGPKPRNVMTSLIFSPSGRNTRNQVSRVLPGVEAGTLLPSGSDEPRCWWATIKTVTRHDYNLAAGRYKPQIAEKAPDEDPAQLIREILGH